MIFWEADDIYPFALYAAQKHWTVEVIKYLVRNGKILKFVLPNSYICGF